MLYFCLNKFYLKLFTINKKVGRKFFLNGNINGNEFQPSNNNFVEKFKPGKEYQEYYRWDNLIHIEIVCFIGGNNFFLNI